MEAIITAILLGLHALWNLVVGIFQWLAWFFPAIFNGELFDLMGRVIRNLGVSALSSLFGLFPNVDTSVFAPYSGAVNWLIPVDYSIGCVAVIVTALGIKMASGWILRWLW